MVAVLENKIKDKGNPEEGQSARKGNECRIKDGMNENESERVSG